MRIIQYPHLTLRRASKPLRRVDAELRTMVQEMFALMYEHKGVGLAANQVDLPYRMFVMNPTGDPTKPDQEFVFINPVLSQPKGSAEEEEGCLSLPGLFAKVRRPERVVLNAYNLSGEEVKYQVDGFFARVVQHETDHLDGVLFIDRLPEMARRDVDDALYEFQAEFDSRRETGEIPNDETIEARLRQLESERT